jgi:hypothetical protein
MDEIDEMMMAEWRSLGFYYDFDESATKKEWTFYGSKKGLYNFVQILEDYTSNQANDVISEHDHYGPYNYLKITTWHNAEISEDSIAGTIKDLIFLKELIAAKLASTQIGQTFSIDKEYGTDNTAGAIFYVMEDDFDPVSMDGKYN